MLVGLQIAIYYIIDTAFDPKAVWLINLKTLCNEDENGALHNDSFKSIGYTFCAFGAYWGLFAQQKAFKGQ